MQRGITRKLKKKIEQEMTQIWATFYVNKGNRLSLKSEIKPDSISEKTENGKSNLSLRIGKLKNHKLLVLKKNQVKM